jgi:hypothetical protein
MTDIEIPATEIEIAEAIYISEKPVADIIRRLSYQRDILKERLKALEVDHDND